MFDIGIGELVALAVIGLLIFGPERLPKAAADAGAARQAGAAVPLGEANARQLPSFSQQDKASFLGGALSVGLAALVLGAGSLARR